MLYDIIGDDELFDNLGDIAKIDPEADARSEIIRWMGEYGLEMDSIPNI